MPKIVSINLPSTGEIPPWVGDLPEGRAFIKASEAKDAALSAFVMGPSEQTHAAVGKALENMVRAGDRFFSIPKPSRKDLYLSRESLPLSIVTTLLLLAPGAVYLLVGAFPPVGWSVAGLALLAARIATSRWRSRLAWTRLYQKNADGYRAAEAEKMAKEIQRADLSEHTDG